MHFSVEEEVCFRQHFCHYKCISISFGSKSFDCFPFATEPKKTSFVCLNIMSKRQNNNNNKTGAPTALIHQTQKFFYTGKESNTTRSPSRHIFWETSAPAVSGRVFFTKMREMQIHSRLRMIGDVIWKET